MNARRLTKQESRQRFAELRELWCEWDPIGAMSEPDWPRDEYDAYVGRSMRFLESDTSDEEFIRFLEHIVGEYIGLGREGIEHSKPKEFVAKMREWFAARWAGTYV